MAVSLLLTSPSTRTRSGEGVRSFELLIVREVPTTRQPRSSSACVTPRPIPLEAPVTTATGCWVVFIEYLSDALMGFAHDGVLPKWHGITSTKKVVSG